MDADGPRYVQVTAAVLGAHGAALGDGLCLVVKVVGVGDITPGKRGAQVPLGDCLLGLWTSGRRGGCP